MGLLIYFDWGKELAGLKKRNIESTQTSGFGSVNENRNGFFASIKPNEIIPKIDKIETLFNNHQSFALRLDEEIPKASYKH